MAEDNAAVNILYEQAVSDIRKQHVKPGNHIEQLKEYKSSNKKHKVHCFFALKNMGIH